MARKTKLDGDAFLKSLYPDLPTTDDEIEAENAAKAAKVEAAKPENARIAALEAQINMLTGALNQPRQAPVEQRQQQAAIQAPQIEYAKAPDPVTDPVGYTKFIQDTVKAQIDYEKHLFNLGQQQQKQATERTNSLWTDFAGQHEGYAANEERAEIATTRVLQRVTAAGLDLDAYMSGNRSAFFNEITREYDKLFGKPEAGNDDTDDDDDGNDDGRSAEIFGGSAAGAGGATAVAKQAPQKYGLLGSDIRTWQEKNGFVR